MRPLKILILVLPALLLLLIAARCPLLALATRQLLRLQGATAVEVRVARLSLHRVSFDAIAFSLPLAGDRITVRLEELTASWNTAGLRAGRLDRIIIDSASVHLPEPANADQGPRTTVPLSLPDPAWQKRFPLHRLLIRQLHLAGRRAGALAGKALALDLNIDNKGVHGNLAVQTTDGMALHLAADLARDNSLTLQLEDGRKAGAEIFRLSVEAGDRHHLTGRFTLQLDRLAQPAALAGSKLPRLSGTISGHGWIDTRAGVPSFSLNLDAGRTRIASLSLERFTLRLDGTMSADRQKILLGTTSHLSLAGLQGPGFAAATADLPLAGTYRRKGSELLLHPVPGRPWTGTGIRASSWQCSHLAIRPALAIGVQADRTTVRLAGNFRLVTGNVRHGDLLLEKLVLAPRQQTEVTIRPGRWTLQPGDWLLTPSVLFTGTGTLRLQPATVTVRTLAGRNGRWHIRGALNSPGLTMAGHGHRLPLSDLVLDLQADARRLRGQIAFSIGQLPGRLEAVFHHAPALARGGAELRTAAPIRFSPEQPLSSLGAGLPVDLDKGRLAITGTASWSGTAPPSLQADVRLDDGAGKAGEIVFSGLCLEERMRILPQPESLAPATITLASLDAGIRAEGMEAVIALVPSSGNREPQLRIDRFTARLFGGRVTASDILLDLTAPDSSAIITISGFDLSEIVRLMQVKDLQVSGLVDGRLPIHLTKEGIRIRDGELRNRPPGGIIRYRPKEKSPLATMEITGYALRAMEDFRYDLLTARVNYRPDGQLNVALHLEGHSPRLETSRPVHLNINTEQNLLSLLKSLRYSRALTDELDKSIQHHYNKPPATTP